MDPLDEIRRIIDEGESDALSRIADLLVGPAKPKGEPKAWLHVMDNTEGIKGNKPWKVLTFTKANPFGKPGRDYSETYPVTSTPLYD